VWPAVGIEQGSPPACRRKVARGEEATLGATAARCQPAGMRGLPVKARNRPKKQPSTPTLDSCGHRAGFFEPFLPAFGVKQVENDDVNAGAGFAAVVGQAVPNEIALF